MGFNSGFKGLNKSWFFQNTWRWTQFVPSPRRIPRIPRPCVVCQRSEILSCTSVNTSQLANEKQRP